MNNGNNGSTHPSDDVIALEEIPVEVVERALDNQLRIRIENIMKGGGKVLCTDKNIIVYCDVGGIYRFEEIANDHNFVLIEFDNRKFHLTTGGNAHMSCDDRTFCFSQRPDPE